MPTNKTAQRVGLEVKAQMVRVGATQRDLAQILGLSQAAVSRRLTGEVPFDVTELITVARLLKVNSADLLGVDAEPVAAA